MFGDKVQILLMEDEYYGRIGTVIEVGWILVKVQFSDGTTRYYNKMDGIDIKKV